MYYTISKNKTAHIVETGQKKTKCGEKVEPRWAKLTQTTESKCPKCTGR